jgi:putative membrane protein
MLPPVLKKNDKKARALIFTLSAVVFAAVVALGRVHLPVNLGFDVHVFALANAVINSVVTVLLMAALIAVKNKNYRLHKNLMLSAMVLSVLFLLSYICHHLLAGETKFGGTGAIKIFYYFILGTHIPLAGLILPFILFTAYRALTAEWPQHKKLARITWPVWLYVAITGVVVYWMISPYYR